MTTGIYKITNKLNKKSYIGQSIHIERRWQEHQKPSSTSKISQAISQYGVDNFTFEIIEVCSFEQLNERENYWINFYNTVNPYGYNIIEHNGSSYTAFNYFDKETLLKIIDDLKNETLSLKQIGIKYNLHTSTISRINKGQIHRISNETYPIRDTHYQLRAAKYCIDCGVEISANSTRCNNCVNNIKRQKGLESLPISREELKQLIRSIPFTTIAKTYNVSDNTIRKWCKKLNLPFKSSEIKKLTDKEWSMI